MKSGITNGMALLRRSRPEPRTEIDEPSSPVARFGPDEPLRLDAGLDLGPWQIAYQT